MIAFIDFSKSEIPPLWWDAIGSKIWKPDTRDPYQLTYTRRCAHLMISKSPSQADTWIVRWKIYSRRKGLPIFRKKPLVHRFKYFTSLQLATAFDVPSRDEDATEPKYAERIGADVAVAGKFARKGKYLLITDPETGDKDSNISTEVKEFISEEIGYFMQHGKTGRG